MSNMDNYFNKDTYTAMYKDQLGWWPGEHVQRLSPGDYEFSDGVLLKAKAKKDLPPLHCNHRLLYETILQLHPTSVVELGVGSGDHCHNLLVLNPDLKVYGYDLLDSQLEFLRERNPDLPFQNFLQWDITTPNEYTWRRDIAFTQAVLMHLSEPKHYLIALANVFFVAKRQVILMENWNNHNYMGDIQGLKNHGMIEWPEIYFHYRVAPERENKPHIMIISATDLKSYPVLKDYQLLVDNMSELEHDDGTTYGDYR